MKNEYLYELVGSIREEFILEAEPKRLAAILTDTPAAESAAVRRNLYTTPDSVIAGTRAVTAKRPFARTSPAKGWLTAACLALAIILLGGGTAVGTLATLGGLGGVVQGGESGISALFGPNFLPSLFPFLSPEESDTPHEVTVRDPEEITDPPDTRTECQKGNHEWALSDTGDATCYRTGTLIYACVSCDETRTEAASLPHTHENGFCTVCGLAEGAWEQAKFSRAYDEAGLPYAIINQVLGDPEGRIVLPNVYYDEGADRLIPVTEIGKNALNGLEKITEVVLPDTVTCIRESAFTKCLALERINFPEGLTSIESNAFNQCTSLTEAHLPESVTELGDNVFMNCTALVSATLPSGFDTIPGGIYGNCRSLTDVTLKGTIKTVGGAAFMGCSSLKQIPDMPELEVIGSNAFENCDGLTEVTLPATLRELGHEAFSSCHSLKKVTFLSPSLAGLLTRVFWGCSSLRELTLPAVVGTFSGQEMLSQCNGNILTIYYPGTREGWQKNYGLRGLDLPINTKVVFMEEETAA